jgi:hypothetical protein
MPWRERNDDDIYGTKRGKNLTYLVKQVCALSISTLALSLLGITTAHLIRLVEGERENNTIVFLILQDFC